MRRCLQTCRSSLHVNIAGPRQRGFCQIVVSMPSIMGSKEGIIEKWLKRPGDKLHEGEGLCEITVQDLTIGIDAPRAGILSEILQKPNIQIHEGEPIAHIVTTLEEYNEHLDHEIEIYHVESQLQEVGEILEDRSRLPDTKSLLKVIKALMSDGKIDEKSAFAKELKKLARKGDTELMNVFEASMDGRHFDEESFDYKFFLSNAQDIVDEHIDNSKN